MTNSTLRLVAILCAAAITGCGGSDNPTQPSLQIAGNYAATEWVTTDGSGQTNQILAGSTLNITLAANGTTSGSLHMPASVVGQELDRDMAGTWTQAGTTVTFAQGADTFVRDMTFSVVANGATWALVGDQVFSGTRVQLTLTRM